MGKKRDDDTPAGIGAIPNPFAGDADRLTLEELESLAEGAIVSLLSEEEEAAILAAVHGALDGKLSPGVIHQPIAATDGIVEGLVARAIRRKVALMVLKAARFDPSSLNREEGASRADSGAGI